MSADFILDCGDQTKVLADDEEELPTGYVWCDHCGTWRRVIEQADPADSDAQVER